VIITGDGKGNFFKIHLHIIASPRKNQTGTLLGAGFVLEEYYRDISTG